MATNDAWIRVGTSILFNNSSPDVQWTMEGLANGAGRVSAQKDLGASPRPGWYDWYCEVQFQTTPTQGKGLELYLAEAPDVSSSMITGDIGTSDAAMGDVDMRRNLRAVGYVVSENSAANEKCIASGKVFISARYVSMAGYNDSGATTHATASNFKFYLVPIQYQGQ